MKRIYSNVGIVLGVCLWRFLLLPTTFYFAAVIGAVCLLGLQYKAYRASTTLPQTLSQFLTSLGVLSNLIVMAANGGRMPVTGLHNEYDWWQPASEASRFLFLADNIRLPVINHTLLIVSIGDLLFVGGLLFWIIPSGVNRFMAERKRRAAVKEYWKGLSPEEQERYRRTLAEIRRQAAER
jgi:hypothetical protein